MVRLAKAGANGFSPDEMAYVKLFSGAMTQSNRADTASGPPYVASAAPPG